MTRSAASVYRALLPWCIAFVGVVGSCIAFWLVRRDEQLRIDNEFRRRTASLAHLAEASLQRQEDAVESMLNLFRYSESVTRDEFECAARQLLTRNPALCALRWVPRVPGEARAAIIEEARHQGTPGYEIRQRNPDGTLVPSQGTAELFPVLYEARREGSESLLGLDLRSCIAWPDFEKAAIEGVLRTSGTDQPGAGGEPAEHLFLTVSPLFGGAAAPGLPTAERPLLGYMVGSFRPADIIEDAIGALPRLGVDVLLMDGIAPDVRRHLHYRPSLLTGGARPPASVNEFMAGLHEVVSARFGGHVFELWMRPVPEWIAGQRSYRELFVVIGGLLSTLALTLWLNAVVRRARDVEALVAERTRELMGTQRELREDIRRRIDAEHALRSSEERYRTFVSQSSDAIWRLELPQPIPLDLPLEEQVDRILDTSHIAECNENTALLYGRPNAGDVLGKSLAELIGKARDRHATGLRAFVRGGYRLSEHESEQTSAGADKRVFRLDLIGVVDSGRLQRIWITEKELTHQRLLEQERRAFEQRLSETQRLESLGVLAGGIAHDFNNLLTGILGHANLARTEIDQESPLQPHLEQIENASRSAANLCQQMLAYAGKGRFIVKSQNLSRIVSDTAHLLQVSVGKHAQLRYNLAPELPAVLADGTQLQQIVMNLVINAAEAISPRTGNITLTTGLTHPDSHTFSDCPYAPEKPAAAYVYLEVRDDGCGMSPDVRTHIFEPFFTTKFSGRGLGLAAAIGIVRSHGGALRVDSEPGRGSAFTVFLPASADTKDSTPPVSTNTPWSGEGTLLIIDDEAPVRGVAERMAQSLGFSALTAPDGAQGIELFRHYGSGIKLVLLDITMPGINCEQTVARLREISPTVRIVLMSGYNQPEADTAASGASNLPFLAKPFTLTQFKTAVRQASNRPVDAAKNVAAAQSLGASQRPGLN